MRGEPFSAEVEEEEPSVNMSCEAAGELPRAGVEGRLTLVEKRKGSGFSAA